MKTPNLKGLSTPELLKLQSDVEKVLAERRSELESELAQLSGKAKHHLLGRRVEPKYASLKDPTKTWAGRGAQPKWLTAEMKESKKRLEAFLIQK